MTRDGGSMGGSAPAPSREESAEALRLREALGIDDPAADSPYVRRLREELAQCSWRQSAHAECVRAAAETEVVLLGEYHPLPTACRTALSLLEALASRGGPLLLGVEMVHARDQHALDAFGRGVIGRRELARRIRYDVEWGYPIAPAIRLLERARALGVPVRGLDIPPRGRVEDLELRDRVAAERIALRLRPGSAGASRWLVVYGEAHLSRAHLPAAIARELGREPAVVRVFHDLELDGGSGRGWLEAGAGTFALQDVAPPGRYKALARVYRRWAAHEIDETALDLALLSDELLDGFAAVLGIDPRRRRVAPGIYLADLYPAAFGPADLSRAARRLRETGHSSARIRALEAQAASRGALFIPDPRVLVAPAPTLAALAREGARFLTSCLLTRAAPDDPLREAVDAALGSILAAGVEPGVPLTELDAAPSAGDGFRALHAAAAGEAGPLIETLASTRPEEAGQHGAALGGLAAAAIREGTATAGLVGRSVFPRSGRPDDRSALAALAAAAATRRRNP